jgi:hypothetical protein
MTSSRWPRAAAAIVATTAISFGAGVPATSARATPDNGSPVCDHLIGMRDAYDDLYVRADNDKVLRAVVARYTWDVTDAGCFGTEAALRQRAFAPSSMPWS